ncbi:hypothetical protein Tco_0407144 [Tanacetum coccineum]
MPSRKAKRARVRARTCNDNQQAKDVLQMRSNHSDGDEAVAPTPEAAIVTVNLGDNFTIKGHHLLMIKDRQFNGRARADPHKHIAEFVEICGMFRYGNTNANALKLFPSSLAGDAKVWFNELTPGVITTWEQMRQAFDMKAKPIHKTVAFAESSNDSKLIEKKEALTTKIDSQFKEIKGEMKEMQDGCNSYGGPHPFLKCDDKPMGGPKDKEAKLCLGGLLEEEDIKETTTVGVLGIVTEEELDALLNDSKPFSTTSEKISESSLDHKFEEFMAHLKYAFLEKNYLLPVVISALLKDDEKKHLVSVSKKHSEALLRLHNDILGISPSFCKHKINFEDDAKPVIQRPQR